MAAAATLVVGTGLQLYGQYRASKDEAKAAEMQAAMREAQAKEILRRSKQDIRQAEREGEQLIGEQRSIQVGQGGSVSSGNLIMAQAEANYNITREMVRIADDAQYQADNIRAGIAVDRQLAEARKTAAGVGMFGTLLTNSMDYMKAKGKA